MLIRLSEDKELIQEIRKNWKRIVITAHVRLKRQMIQNVCVKNLENKKMGSVIVDYILKS